MNHTIYFADRALLFSDCIPAETCAIVHPDDPKDLSRAKILKILETNNTVAVICPDPDAAYTTFSAQFTKVEAAGGVVVDDRGDWLMIHRNGRWDLPKGHIEQGETYDICAEREILEETGVAARVVRPLCKTQHAYWFEKTARWELKHTWWYLLHPVSTTAQTRPQTEEGITAAVWCSPEQVDENLHHAFPTIRCVAEAIKTVDL